MGFDFDCSRLLLAPWHLGHNDNGQSSLQFVPADFWDIRTCGGGRCLSIKLNL
jgi:hypothetical protein